MSQRRPPITSSLAASCASRLILEAGGERCLLVDFVDAYPEGLHVKITARFRDQLELEADRARGQAWSFVTGGGDAPTLEWSTAGRTGRTGAFTSNSAEALLRTDFWCPIHDVGQFDVAFQFTWRSEAIAARFDVDRNSIAAALPLWRELWPPESDRRLHTNLPD